MSEPTPPDRAALAARSGRGAATADQRLGHAIAVRVYWEDTDAGGVVFYANYLRFFERARTEWLRAAGIGQQGLRERTQAQFIVTETGLKYHQPARLDDLLRITVLADEIRAASMRLTQQAWRDDLLLCEASIRIGCVDAGTFRPRRIPNEVLVALGGGAEPAAPASSPAGRPPAGEPVIPSTVAALPSHHR